MNQNTILVKFENKPEFWEIRTHFVPQPGNIITLGKRSFYVYKVEFKTVGDYFEPQITVSELGHQKL